jgi:hypothetical protein
VTLSQYLSHYNIYCSTPSQKWLKLAHAGSKLSPDSTWFLSQFWLRFSHGSMFDLGLSQLYHGMSRSCGSFEREKESHRFSCVVTKDAALQTINLNECVDDRKA